MSIIKTHDYVLKRDNIKLRPMTDEDLDIIFEWNSDAEVLYWCEGDDVESYELEDIQSIYGQVSQNAWCFIIEYDKTPVGDCWLQRMNMQHIIDEFPDEVIYRIDITMSKNYWNKGIGTRVVKMLTEFGFARKHAEKIFYLVGDYNKRSIRVAEKAGYKIHAMIEAEGTKKAKFDIDMVMTRTEFYDIYNPEEE